MNIFKQTYENCDELLNKINDSESIDISKKMELINKIIDCKLSKLQDFIDLVVTNIDIFKTLIDGFNIDILNNVCCIEIVKPKKYSLNKEHSDILKFIFVIYYSDESMVIADSRLSELYRINNHTTYDDPIMSNEYIYVIDIHNDMMTAINIITKEIVNKNYYCIRNSDNYDFFMIGDKIVDGYQCGVVDICLNEIIKPIYDNIEIVNQLALCYIDDYIVKIINFTNNKEILKGTYTTYENLGKGILYLKSDNGVTIYNTISQEIFIENDKRKITVIDTEDRFPLISILENDNKYSLVFPEFKHKYFYGISDDLPIVNVQSNYIVCTDNNKVSIHYLSDGAPLEDEKLSFQAIFNM